MKTRHAVYYARIKHFKTRLGRIVRPPIEILPHLFGTALIRLEEGETVSALLESGGAPMCVDEFKVGVLVAVHHHRINYPDLMREEDFYIAQLPYHRGHGHVYTEYTDRERELYTTDDFPVAEVADTPS